MSIPLQPGRHYQHKYGGIYFLIKFMTNKTTDETVAHYKHVYPYPEHEAVRSVEDFQSCHRLISSDEELKSFLDRPAAEFQKEITETKNTSKSKSNSFTEDADAEVVEMNLTINDEIR